jgi:hypothetical protein
MFGHDDHHDNQATPEVHVNDDLLQPEDLDRHSHEDHAAAVEAAPGAVEITPEVSAGADDNTAAVIMPTSDDDSTEPAHHDHTAAPAVIDSSDPLFGIKRDALQSLSPLLGHLDQTPEEKFRTTMMLIQATDNKDLIGDAYSAAKAIEDEKARAQALLDVVNEINYFTQPKDA